MKLLIATTNVGKALEFGRLLNGLPVMITSLREEAIAETVEETGSTFAENAGLKAHFYSKLSRLLTIAEDSGLEVDMLNGDPGVRSARFAGIGATDHDRNLAILARLQGIPWDRRTARFRAVLAVAQPEHVLFYTEGVVEGVIALEPQGDEGFGYDPIFYVPALGKTMAELPLNVKNAISHRARAVEALRSKLEAFLSTTPTSRP